MVGPSASTPLPSRRNSRYEVGEVTDDGAVVTATITRISVEGDGTGISAAAVDDLEEQLAPMVGLTGTGTITPFGSVRRPVVRGPG